MRTFEKHVGGSPANIAFGLVRLGVRTAFVGRVSDDMIGRWVRDALGAEGIDTTGVVLDDSGTRTSLALTEMRARDCDVVIHRHAAADLALRPDDLDLDRLGGAALLVLSGTALASEPSRAAAFAAARAARAGGARVVLDLDYRPYTWASAAEAREVCGRAAREADVVIGNGEEIALLREEDGGAEDGEAEDGASPDDAALVTTLHRAGVSLVCIKAGEAGSCAWPRGGEPIVQPAFPVEAIKPFGAGDAYAAALCAGLLADEPLEATLERAAAAAAIVVASGACGDASPTRAETDAFVAGARARSPSSLPHASEPAHG